MLQTTNDIALTHKDILQILINEPNVNSKHYKFHKSRLKKEWASVNKLKDILLDTELSDYGKITKIFTELKIQPTKQSVKEE